MPAPVWADTERQMVSDCRRIIAAKGLPLAFFRGIYYNTLQSRSSARRAAFAPDGKPFCTVCCDRLFSKESVTNGFRHAVRIKVLFALSGFLCGVFAAAPDRHGDMYALQGITKPIGAETRPDCGSQWDGFYAEKE